MTKAQLSLTGGIVAHQDWGVPKIQYVHDLVLEGDGTGYGIHCDASYVVFERVWVRGFYINLVLSNAVSVTFRSCHFSRATEANVFIPWNTIATTIVFDACAFRGAPYGLMIQTGAGISLVNRCIVELNTKAGVVIDPQPGSPFPLRDIVLDHVWFEANPTNIVGREWATIVG
ncbi:MAG: hypothetical protein WBC51_04965 [Vicinamibacterales bacterium]